jgi:hypothetical protein
MTRDPHKFTTLEMQALAECFPIAMKYTKCAYCGQHGEKPCINNKGKPTDHHILRIKDAHRILSIGWDEAIRLDVEAYLGA